MGEQSMFFADSKRDIWGNPNHDACAFKTYDETTARNLAHDVMQQARENLSARLRFLRPALYNLEAAWEDSPKAMGMDAKHVYYDWQRVLDDFEQDTQAPARTYLHMVLHGVYHHLFQGKNHDPYWTLACDMAVEHTILTLNMAEVASARDETEWRVLEDFKEKVGRITAEKLYRHLLESDYSPERLEDLARLFERDTHIFWRDPDADAEEVDMLSQKEAESRADAYTVLEGQSDTEQWDILAEALEMEIETEAEGMGNVTQSLLENIRPMTSTVVSYKKFLQRFVHRKEEARLSPDEFDYIYYTYGLKLYDNLPLIEPLEYHESNKIDTLVIAIDTSGSTAGDLVQKFLVATRDMLLTKDQFFKEVHIRILQCDTEIKKDTLITNVDDFSNYIANETLEGFGGTDFRPVFRRIEQEVAQHHLRNLRGLIYFTDGIGIYPEKKPSFDTAFIFEDANQAEEAEVPRWAMKAILEEGHKMDLQRSRYGYSTSKARN